MNSIRGLCSWLLLIVLAVAATHTAATPIKLKPIAVTASNSWGAYPASNAVDGNPDTVWISGNYANQWIELDFGRTVGAWKIRLLVHQDPAGPTTHKVYAGQTPGNLRFVATLNGATATGHWLEYTGGTLALGGTRYVRVETTASPSWVAWAEIEVYQGVEHFGPFASAADGHGTGDYTTEVVSWGSNLTWIYGGDIVGKLTNARNAGAKAVLDARPYLLNGSVPLLNWEQHWANVANLINGAGLADTVAAFYLDEPYLYSTNDAALRDSLVGMAATIRNAFPTAAVATILSMPEMQRLDASHVSMFDWVGFDCYRPWEDCHEGIPTDVFIDRLRSWMSPSQRMIAVPEAFWPRPADLLEEQVLVDRMNQWHRRIVWDARYVAIVPFLWPTHAGIGVGTRDLAWVKERVHQFAMEMIHPAQRLYPVNYYTSSNWTWHGPFAATNRNPDDTWVSGNFAPASIFFDLGGSTRLTKVELLVSQDPPGSTVHQVYGWSTSGTWLLLGTFSQHTADSQWLTWTGSADVSVVEIRTTASPSWVGWREVLLYRSP